MSVVERRLAAAREIYDRDAKLANSDTTHTSRPDAVPTWDDLTASEQFEVAVRYLRNGLIE